MVVHCLCWTWRCVVVATLLIKVSYHQYQALGSSEKGPRNPKAYLHLPAACNAQPLKDSQAICTLGKTRVSGSHQGRKSGIHQVNTNSGLAPVLCLGPFSTKAESIPRPATDHLGPADLLELSKKDCSSGRAACLTLKVLLVIEELGGVRS